MTIAGYIEKIVYQNESNGYCVLSVETGDGDETLVGYMHGVTEGSYIEAECEAVDHPQYDLQYKVSSYQLKMPDDIVSIEKYLGSGAIKGIGEVMAKKITGKFKLDTFRIIEEEPEQLAQIKGISMKKAQDIALQFREKQELRDAMVFLGKYDITPQLAVRIFEEYGQDIYHIIQTNPYKIAEDVTGVGFKTADAIARKAGIGADSEFRCRAAILYTLSQSALLGYIYLPMQMLCRKVADLLTPEEPVYYEEYMSGEDPLGLTEENFRNQIDGLLIEHKIVLKEVCGEEVIYESGLYHMELDIARMLHELDITEQVTELEVKDVLKRIEREDKLTLDMRQAEAVQIAATAGFTVITGGPGTGKTTTIHGIIKYFEKLGSVLLLAAPTGRAAKRITETSGYPAQTIHRLLELSSGVEDEAGYRFERNASNPLEADVIIVDEASMIDTYLMHALLKAIMPGTHLILVGDENQLPSVGPGNVLRDILQSECFRVTRLTKIFRQDEDSDIILNAHKINRGEALTITNKSKDFFMLQRRTVKAVLDELCVLVKDNLPGYLHVLPEEIQVLTPMRKGELGVEGLNPVLQTLLNPPSPDKQEHVAHGTTFREGDKVMQIKNDYQMSWKIISDRGGFVGEEGLGIFNGDMGRITEISVYAQTVTVLFDDNKQVEYLFSALDELELAYAVTVHKSQGSEYPAVVMPILTGPRVLFNRNLLYTAVTRAKKCVVIPGNPYMLNKMIENNETQNRYSSLHLRLKEFDYI